MSSRVSPFPWAACAVTAFALIVALFFGTDLAAAGDGAGCSCPDAEAKPPRKPKLAAYPAPLDESDEIAALESVQFALTEVGDGATYVWRRSHGRLSGVVKPMRSYKDASGAVCRRAIVILNGLDGSKRTETSACRGVNGVWRLEG